MHNTTLETSHSDSTANHNTNPKIVAYLIGHDPDSKYLKRLLPDLIGLIDSLIFVSTDGGTECLDFLAGWTEFEVVTDSLYSPSREDFNFEVARNRALDLAEQQNPDWLFWLDCDDRFENAAKTRKYMEQLPDADCFAIPYEVNVTQTNLFKTRIHRPGQWKWRGRVHEELRFQLDRDPKIYVLNDLKVRHCPDEGKTNNLWHIELLKKDSEMAVNNWCYIAKEYFNVGDWENCIEWARKFLPLHPFDIEVYHGYLILGISLRQLGRVDEAIEELQKALLCRPHRREAYFYLAETHGKRGTADDLARGLGYISACNAQINHKEPMQHGFVYDLSGYKLHAKYLKEAGHISQAIQVMNKIEPQNYDAEAKTIMLELEEASKQQAIRKRDNLTKAA